MDLSPLLLARGYGEPPLPLERDADGAYTIAVSQGNRIELRLTTRAEEVYQLVGDERRPLPTGSTWDRDAQIFYWQPAAAFLGEYHLVFASGRERISVRVVVSP